MFLRKKAQSTAEYAITIGLVVAVAAGILQVALKGGMRQKNKQALNYFLEAGHDVDEFAGADDQDIELYTEEFNKNKVKSGDYVDETVLEQGGAEKRHQVNSTESSSVDIELIHSAK